MKRVHVEFMVATIILAWVITNIVLMKPTDDIQFFAVFFPILFGVVIQYIGLMVEAATTEGSN